MKRLTFAVILLAGLAASTAQAGTATTTFPVNISLTPGCGVSTPSAAGLSFTYTGMQVAAATASTTVGITCTNGATYSVSLSTAPGNGYTVTDTATNLIYTLTLNGAGANLAGQAGTGVEKLVTVGGSIAGGQAGTCALALCTNATSTNLTQTMTITY